jgi:hypothetical protein
VTELEELQQRRDLVVLAARLQRATMMRRIERLRASPAKHVFGVAALAARRPAIMTLGTAAARFALKFWKRRAERRRLRFN